MTLPASLEYGHVVGRIILAVADGVDVDRIPDSAPASGTVTFTPKNPQIRVGAPAPVLVVKQPITCTLDVTGNLIDPEGAAGVWLVTGVYSVKYNLGPTVASVAHDIEVLAPHTETDPLDLTTAMPPGGPILTASEYAELSSRIDSLELGVTSWDEVTDKPAAFTPTAHASSHASDGSDPITPASIGAIPAQPGYFSGHLDDAPEGWVRLTASATGLPPNPDLTAFVRTSRPVAGSPHAVQMVVTNPSAFMFLRTNNAGTWGAWVMVPASTGPRSLTPENGWTGTITIDREGSTVTLDVTAANGTNATSEVLVTIPAGYRPRSFKGLLGTGRTSPASGHAISVCQLQTGGALKAVTTETNLFLTATWTTRNNLPTTLPGTPA